MVQSVSHVVYCMVSSKNVSCLYNGPFLFYITPAACSGRGNPHHPLYISSCWCLGNQEIRAHWSVSCEPAIVRYCCTGCLNMCWGVLGLQTVTADGPSVCLSCANRTVFLHDQPITSTIFVLTAWASGYCGRPRAGKRHRRRSLSGAQVAPDTRRFVATMYITSSSVGGCTDSIAVHMTKIDSDSQ